MPRRSLLPLNHARLLISIGWVRKTIKSAIRLDKNANSKNYYQIQKQPSHPQGHFIAALRERSTIIIEEKSNGKNHPERQ
jgi:hypothetical protein